VANRKVFDYGEFKKSVENAQIDKSKKLLLVNSDTTSEQIIRGYYFPSLAGAAQAGTADEAKPRRI
jgi:hypothetical protein